MSLGLSAPIVNEPSRENQIYKNQIRSALSCKLDVHFAWVVTATTLLLVSHPVTKDLIQEAYIEYVLRMSSLFTWILSLLALEI